jgi:hypothetical protein
MSTLEDQLRDSLRYRATLPRLGDDVAGAAIRGASTVKLRRLATVAAAFVLVAAIAGVSFARGPSAAPAPGGPAPTTSTPSPTTDVLAHRFGVNLDVLDGRDLWTLEGGHFDMPARPDYITRVPSGWLYGNFSKPTNLLRTSGTSIVLPDLVIIQGGLDGPAGPAVSSDGTRVAWVSNHELHAATVTANGLTNELSAPVLPTAYAASWIGDMVLVGYPYEPGCCGSNHVEYDVWDPTKGPFVASWTKSVYPFNTPVPRGTPAVVRVPVVPGQTNSAACLIVADGVHDMSVAGPRGCPPGLDYASTGAMLSPDGTHLIDYDFTGGPIAIYSLPDIATRPTAAGRCPYGDRALIWENATTFLTVNQTTHSLARCRVDLTQAVDLGPAPADGWQPVARYGV